MGSSASKTASSTASTARRLPKNVPSQTRELPKWAGVRTPDAVDADRPSSRTEHDPYAATRSQRPDLRGGMPSALGSGQASGGSLGGGGKGKAPFSGEKDDGEWVGVAQMAECRIAESERNPAVRSALLTIEHRMGPLEVDSAPRVKEEDHGSYMAYEPQKL